MNDILLGIMLTSPLWIGALVLLLLTHMPRMCRKKHKH